MIANCFSLFLISFSSYSIPFTNIFHFSFIHYCAFFFQFTFDKDGKVIDGALPLVDITDSSAKPTGNICLRVLLDSFFYRRHIQCYNPFFAAVEHTVYDVTIDKTQGKMLFYKTCLYLYLLFIVKCCIYLLSPYSSR